MVQRERALVDVVAVINLRWSMGFDDKCGHRPNDRLVQVKEAMAKVIENLGVAAQNRLAVIGFDQEVATRTELFDMTAEGQQSATETVNALKAMGRPFTFSVGLNEAKKILDGRSMPEKRRSLGFTIFVSNGDDITFLEKDIPTAYPIHALGLTAQHSPSKLKAMANRTLGSYTPIENDLETKLAEKLDQLSVRLTSVVAVDTAIDLTTLHPGVFVSKLESSWAYNDALVFYKSEIGGGKTSGKVVVGDVSAGEMKEFTVYLEVPAAQGQQDGNGTDDDIVMELLKVGGVYKQSWDRDKKKVPLGEFIVTVVSDKNTQELDWIEERVAYWCKVKLDLSAMHDKAEAEAGVKPAAWSGGEVTEALALQEASVEAINRAMHHDIYNAVLLALKLRRGGDSGNIWRQLRYRKFTTHATALCQDTRT
ncbi:unnamed protein product [Miscanthus lutarioriparius]|uniref:VWFA domain-containing protein n=1 Tax=Miscanthus lutarioriparius TaxID=422564 RepID=A0A811QYF6_9POAL|nr:unnamed protein product [Miscanthus lutarioriparius]